MIQGIGVDIEEIYRFTNCDQYFLELIFSEKEIEYCKGKKNPEISLAGKFCAKEATIKACKEKIAMKDIEILNDKTGQPNIFIKGQKNELLKCSISHIKDTAIAFVVKEGSK